MAKAGVPESWMTMLGILKAAGALGLLIGIVVPLIGTAAAVASSFSLSLPSSPTCARDYSYGLAVVFLLLAGRAGAGTACQEPGGVGASGGVGGIVRLQLIGNEVNMTFYSPVQFIDLTALASDALVRSK